MGAEGLHYYPVFWAKIDSILTTCASLNWLMDAEGLFQSLERYDEVLCPIQMLDSPHVRLKSAH